MAIGARAKFVQSGCPVKCRVKVAAGTLGGAVIGGAAVGLIR